ncbi:MAG: hypothetical protein IIB00_02605 [candidate division Zixibacteria bacterium]|nr:hypothetical protein [candidate division Zixibacteria bacterium]
MTVSPELGDTMANDCGSTKLSVVFAGLLESSSQPTATIVIVNAASSRIKIVDFNIDPPFRKRVLAPKILNLSTYI